MNAHSGQEDSLLSVSEVATAETSTLATFKFLLFVNTVEHDRLARSPSVCTSCQQSTFQAAYVLKESRRAGTFPSRGADVLEAG